VEVGGSTPSAPTMIIKTETVLDLDDFDRESGTVAFMTPEEEDPADSSDRVFVLGMFTEAWNDFGQPTQVTVTIEPGDRLNG
jgi:hypothetical protein